MGFQLSNRAMIPILVLVLCGCYSRQSPKSAVDQQAVASDAVPIKASNSDTIPLNPANPVDTTLVRAIDVTGDRLPERIELALRSRDFYSPIQWDLRVLSGRDTLYAFSDSGVALEDRFKDLETDGYLTSKYRFFFRDFAELQVSDTLPGYLKELGFNRKYAGCVYTHTKQWLEDNEHMSKTLSDSLATLIEVRIRANALPILDHSDGVLDVVDPLAFVQELNRLVPIYSQ